MAQSKSLVPVERGTPLKPINETSADRFRRLANGRATDAIAAIERLGNLASPQYTYDERQIVALESAIRDALKRACDRLRTRTALKIARKEII